MLNPFFSTSKPAVCSVSKGFKRWHRTLGVAAISAMLAGMGAAKVHGQQLRWLGLDVSAWQGNITQTTWNNIRTNENRQFVFIRASRGGTTGYYNQNDADNSEGLNTFSQRYDDPYFVQNINRATSAGILAGSYHFSRPDIIASTTNSGGIPNTGADEADHFIQMAGAWMRPGYLLPVHDLEAGQAQRSSSALSQFGVEFSDRVYQVMGIRPLVYVSQSYANYVNSTIPAVHPDFWIARYANQTDPESIDVQNGHPPPSPATANVYGKWNPNHTVANPYPDGHPWSFWQYASTVRLQSFNNGGSNLDGNVAQGGMEFVKDFLVPAVWMADNSGQWTTLANWNSGQTPVAPVPGPGQVTPVGTQTLPTPRLPESNDTVVLDRPSADITVTLASGAHNIRKFYARESFALTGGSLTINYVPSWDSTPIAAQFSAPVTLSSGAVMNVHTLQVDATRTFTAGAGTLQFNRINLMPGAVPAKIALIGDMNLAVLSGGTNAIVNGSGAGNAGRVDLGGGNRILNIADSSVLSIEVPIENGALTKAGTGTLRLTSTNTYSGGTTISAGELFVSNGSGSGTGTGTVTVNSGGTLSGTGSIAGSVSLGSNGTVRPASSTSVGVLTAGGMTLAGNAKYQWNIRDVSEGAGVGWDKLMVNGTINITASSANKIVIDVTSLTESDERGEVHNFNNGQTYSWPIAEASGGILNFASDKFQIITSSFDNSFGSGAFTVTQSGNTIRLNFGPTGPPIITSHPQSQSVALNNDATFSVTASGANPLFYQWRFEGTNLLLATASSYTRANAQLSDAGGYSVVVWNAIGSVTSVVANLTVLLPPTINTQPVSLTNHAGTTASFSVTASGTGLSHQWLKDGAALNNGGNVSGATSPSLTITAVSAADEAGYSVIVSNNVGAVTSSLATLTVAQPPTLLKQPQSQTRLTGEDAVFSVLAEGFQPISFQWSHNGDPIAGATQSTYTRSAVQLAHAGSYSVVISNEVGSVISSNAGLAVIPSGPFANITNIWNIRADSRLYVTSGNTERGIAINPFTGHVLLTSRSPQLPGGLGVIVLDAETGVEVGALNIAPVVNTGTFKLNKIGVAEDGAIYAANLTTASATTDLVIYRWSDEASTPSIAFSGKPDGGITARWGDSFAIRGGGTNTQLLISGSGTTTNIALFTTSNGLSFQVSGLSASPIAGSGEFSQGLTFGAGDTFYSKHASQSSNTVKQFSFTPEGTIASQTASIPMEAAVMAIRMLAHQNLLCAVLDDNSTNNSGHQVRLYNVANLASPVLISNFNFLPIANGTNSLNPNRAGHVDTDGVRIIALDTQNGVVALKMLFGDAPSITSPPSHSTVTLGQTAQFSVVVEGDAPLSFRWRKNGADLFDDGRIMGAGSDTLTISNAVPADAADYSVHVSNPFGSTTSDAATLSVVNTPIILSHPTNRLVRIGTNVTFGVEAVGPNLLYQWLFDETPILNATNPTFTRLNVQSQHAGAYSVIVSNTAGAVVSSNALLTVSNDQTPPVVTISFPAAKQRLVEMTHVTNGVLVVRGTTSDNVAAVRVEYQLNGGSWITATGTFNWSAAVNLNPGSNTVTLRAFDAVNNVSAAVSRTFTYAKFSLLSAAVAGGGVLSPNLDNQSLEIAKNYRMTALPISVDWLFTNWTRHSGGHTNVVSSNAVLDFPMESNLALRANFITNPFVRAAGIYNGLFYSTNGVSHHSSGLIVLKVTPKLGYSAKLLLDGNAISFSGKLSVPGTATKDVSRAKFGKSPLHVEFIMDFADHVSGFVSASNWTAQLSSDRWVWTDNIGQQALNFTNVYTFVLPGLSNPTDGPPGMSYGVVKIDKLGKVRLSGRASDHHVIRQGTKISKTGEWPFYTPMYVEKRAVTINGVSKTNREFQGSMLGWISFSTNQAAGKTTLAPLGNVSWVNTGWTNTLYGGGFTNVTATIGSRYGLPAIGEKVLNLTSSQLQLSGGNLGNIANQVTLLNNNTLSVQTTPFQYLRGGISRSGPMQGVFAHPGLNHAQVRFFGVALPDHNRAYGYFLGTNQGGLMELKP